MIITLLVVLAVELIVVVAVLAFMLARKRWVSHQPGSFKGAIRVVDGEVPRAAPGTRHGTLRHAAARLTCGCAQPPAFSLVAPT